MAADVALAHTINSEDAHEFCLENHTGHPRFGVVALATVAPAVALSAYGAATPRTVVDSPTAITGPTIVGGTRSKVPWAVQVAFSLQVPEGVAGWACTGVQINKSWVLTAKHCSDNSEATTVYQSDSKIERGKARIVDRIIEAPAGDFVLVHLAKAAPLKSYPTLNLDYVAKTTGKGTIYGFGYRRFAVDSDALYKATVRLAEASTDAIGADAQGVKGITGASRGGDSGGPLVVNGSVVGICSLAFGDADTDVREGGSDYTLLSVSADWIRQTAGI